MPSGKSQLQVILNYKDNLSGKAGRTVASLRAIDKAAGSTLKTIEALTKALGRGGTRGGSRGGLGVGTRPSSLKPQLDQLRLQTQQTRLQREQLKLSQDKSRLALVEARTGGAVSKALVEEVRLRKENARLSQVEARTAQIRERTSSAGELADLRALRERVRLQREELKLQSDMRRGRGRRAGWVDELNRKAHFAQDVKGVYDDARDRVRGYTDPAGELMRSRARLGALGLSGDEEARATESINKTVAEVRGARLSDVTQSFAELYEVFGSVEDTARNLPRAAKYSFALKTLHGDRYSSEQLISQTKSAYKFIDLLGLTKPDAQGRVDQTRADAYHDQLLQVMSATGGDVDPREMHALAKIGGTSLLGMSREGLTHMAALAGDVGGSRAGNLQRSLFQSFVGGKLYPKHVKALDGLGMIDRSKVLKKTGGKYELLPGGVKHAETISTDPLIFVDKIAEALRSKGVDTTNESQVVNATAGLTGNVLSQQALAQLIIRRAEVTRFDEIVKRAEATDKLYDRATGLPIGQIEDRKAKAENLRATAGTPMLEAGGSLSEQFARALTGLQSLSSDSPVMAATLAGIGTLGTAALSTGDGLNVLTGLLGQFKGGGAGGGIAGTGADTSDLLSGGYFGWRALRGALALTPKALGPAAIAALGVGSVYTLHKQYKHDTETRHKAEGDASSQFETVKRLREQHGGRLPDDVARQLSSKAFPGLDRRGLLNELDVKTYGTAGYPGVSTGPRYDRDAVMAGGFARRAPELQYPELMRGFIADIRQMVSSGAMTQQAGDRTLGVAQQAFPEAYKAATESLAQEIAQLTGQVTPLTGAFTNLQTPTTQLAAGLGSAQGAAQNFASRVNALDLTVPLPTLVPFPVTTPGVPAAGAPWKPPQSAVGSVVQRDGLVHAHRGNVIVPARLSRRSPGDWLEDFDALRAFDREAVAESEGAGKVDYSAFYSAPVSRSAPEVNVTIQSISVPAGGEPREAAAAIAAEVAAQVREALRRLAALEGDVYDPRFIANMAASEMGRERARA